MALRSLAGKMGARLLRWPKASGDAVRQPATDLDMLINSLKLENSFEANIAAVLKRFKKQSQLREEEAQRRIRKNYRDAALYVVGSWAFFCTFAAEALADDAKSVNAEEARSRDAEDSRAMDFKEAKAMDAEDN